MNRFAILFLAAGVLWGQKQPPPPQSLRAVLLEQLHTTHDQEDWFVPINVAVEGLTPEQASWTDGHGNHSVGQLANHLAFWDERSLAQFKGEKSPAFNGNNDETFTHFDAQAWHDTVTRLDRVMKAWEEAVEICDETKLKANASLIAHIGTHNAYHVGQMVYVRKLQGAWNPAKGVK